MDKITGVYAVTNKRNGKQYIGSSVNVHHRWGVHRSYLKQGRHHSALLQTEWTEQQGSDFVLEVLEETEKERLIEREQWYLTTRQPAYNISTIAGNAFRDPAIQARLPRGRDAREYTEETAAKISASLTGKKLSPEHRAKISAVQQGKVLPEEQREKISASMSGNPKLKKPKSEEHKAKLREAIKRKNEDPAYRAMMKESLKTRKPPDTPRSQESRERSRQARTAAWERQKAEGYVGPERDETTGRFLKSSEEGA